MSPGSTSPKADRKFTLLDGMILVGVTAVALASTRWIDLIASIRFIASEFAWEWDFFDQAVPLLMPFATLSAMAMAAGMLAMRLRKPRPRRRRLARQPGLVACLAAVGGGAVGGAFTVVNVLSIDREAWPTKTGVTYAQVPFNWLLTFAKWGSFLGGFAVMVAWATLALVGRWRAEPTWLDRLGRLVGLASIVLALVACFVLRSTS